MANGTQRLAIDFGNSYINVVGEDKKGVIKKDCIPSTFGELQNTKIVKKNTVKFGDTLIQLGKNGGEELSNVRKIERQHLEHQILWAAYAIMGAGDHYVRLATGLPLMDYTSDTGSKEEFQKHLESMKSIAGEVNEQKVTVNIVSPVEVCPEGYSAVDVLIDLLAQDKRTLIIDVGMKTTDYALVEYNEEEDIFEPIAYNTVRNGLDSIYAPVISKLANLGETYTATEIDALYHKNRTITLRDKSEFNVVEEVLKSVQPCKSILKAIENDKSIGDITRYAKAFVGGGAKALEDIMSTDDLTNVIEVSEDLKYYANALGYFETLE